MENYSRRDAMKLAAVGAAVLAGGSNELFAAKLAPVKVKPVKTAKISLQLYSVRGSCKKDFDGVLEKVAKMGYQGVEFAGYSKYGAKPEELKKKLDSLGLIAAGTHIRAHTFTDPKNIQKTIDFHKTIGCKYLCCPSDGAFCHPERSKKLADDLRDVLIKLKDAAKVEVNGEQEERIIVEFDNTKLKLYGLTSSSLKNIISSTYG